MHRRSTTWLVIPTCTSLGAQARGRKQVQILVRRDDCCFGEAQHDKNAGMTHAASLREYEGRVRAALDGIGRGSFRVEIDETAAAHMISHHSDQGGDSA